MEKLFKNVSDITYLSDILHFVQNRPQVLSEAKDELIPSPSLADEGSLAH